MNDVVQIESQPVQDQRAHQVKAELEALVSTTEDATFNLADLLLEAKENSYHQTFGFARFNDWIELTPSFDISARQAAYLVNMADKALRLEVSRETMKLVKIGKLKEIFSLDPNVHKDEMLALLEIAPALSMKELQYKVAALKTEEGQEVMLHMTLKYPESARETIDLALEKARRMIGTSKDSNGDQVEPSNGKCVTSICADFIAGPDELSYAEQMAEGAEAIA